MTIKEKTENILGGFLERNENYAIEVYVRNGITNNIITRLLIPINRSVKSEEKKYLLKWKVDDIQSNELSLPYDEIMDCYEERDEYNIQTVVIILKNGMKVELECCGDRV